jgi:uncharacterized repeat protein (TIGR04076 family)
VSHPICDLMVEEKERNPQAIFEANDNRCRYHSAAAENKQVPILSQGMCPVAYLNLYPTLFALHLNQDESLIRFSSKGQVVQCPAGPEGVSFRVFRTKAKLNPIEKGKNLLRKIANIVMPVELFDKHTNIEAVDEGQGCPLGIKKGATFDFNLDKTDEFCPAAFNSAYPLLGKKNDFAVGCPDHRTNVKFALPGELIDKGNKEQDNCDKYYCQVKITKVFGDFYCPLELNRWYSIDEVLGISGARCFSSFHVAFPYLYALFNGGQLGFLTGDRESAGVGCPNTALLVKYIVSRDKQGQFKYTSTSTHPGCPRKIGLNENIVIEDFERAIPFYYGLYDLYTALNKVESKRQDPGAQIETSITSMKEETGLVWSISGNANRSDD